MTIGIDIVDVGRFASTIERAPGLRRRFFTTAELAYCEGSADHTLHLAATFAAKEAVMKARGLGPAAAWMKRIEVLRRPSGAPIATLDAKELPVSISHDAGVVVAIATDHCSCLG